MGLFSGKKITYVSSVAYNMAGDQDQRPSYIKSLVLKNITSDTSDSIATTITTGYMNGPQMDFRKFYRWAKDNYTTVGLPSARINGLADISINTVLTQLPPVAGQTPYVLNAEQIMADYTAWAEQYILQNHPDLYDTNWASFYLDTGQILIQYADGTSETFTPVGYNQAASYIYILYSYYVNNDAGPVVTGSTHTLGDAEPWPSTSGWTTVTDTSPTVSVPLTTTTTITKSYSDGRPDETTTSSTSSTGSYVDREAHFTKTDPAVQDPSSDTTKLYSRKHDMYFMTSYEIVSTTNETTNTYPDPSDPSVTITEVTTTVTQSVHTIRQWREDYQDTVLIEYTSTNLWLYQIGSGNAVLDAMVNNPTTLPGEFFPCIPVRIDNKFISDSYYSDVYSQSVKAYKKLTKKKFSSLVSSISDNPSLSDIDYAFVVFGVSLNVKEIQCRKYLFRFFEVLAENQEYGADAWTAFKAALDNYNIALDAFKTWLDGGGQGARPSLPTAPSPSVNTIRIHGEGTVDIPYDIRMEWSYAFKTTASGSLSSAGNVWIEKMDTFTWTPYVVGGRYGTGSGVQLIAGDQRQLQHIRVYWQITDDTYQYMDVFGLHHYNYVYNGKAVSITGNEALDDTDESGFIVPMHYNTMRKMSLMASTQMTTACCFIVFNCYQVVKQKWYETGIFRIILIVAIAIVSAVFAPGGIGLLGANITVGSYFGLSGITAAIVGSITNAIAAVVVSSIISKVSTAIFGEEFGAIIGAVISFAVFNAAANFQATGSFSLNWGEALKAQNLLKLTDVASQGYSAYINAVNQGLAGKTQDLIANYNSQSQNIKDLTKANLGYTDVLFNPYWITQSNVSYSYEPSSTFLARTLMTGSDIAQMSQDMLSEYTTLNLTLPSVYG